MDWLLEILFIAADKAVPEETKRAIALIGIGLALIVCALFSGLGTLNAVQYPNNFGGIAPTAVVFMAAILGLVGLRFWNKQHTNPDRPNNPIRSITHLRATGRLCRDDSPLVMAHWRGIDLSGADLHNANMRGIDLRAANLSYANLFGARLREACLIEANLTGSNLSKANLHNAQLKKADLRNAVLDMADLKWADLIHAHLEGASLRGALFNPSTILPDGETWTPDISWARYGVRHQP